jgi:hypothetical protein
MAGMTHVLSAMSAIGDGLEGIVKQLREGQLDPERIIDAQRTKESTIKTRFELSNTQRAMVVRSTNAVDGEIEKVFAQLRRRREANREVQKVFQEEVDKVMKGLLTRCVCVVQILHLLTERHQCAIRRLDLGSAGLSSVAYVTIEMHFDLP